MAKIVLSAAGSAGDVHPVLTLAAELKRRGHRPVIATQAEYRPAVEAMGLEFHPLRPSQEEIEDTLGVSTPELVRLTTQASTGLEFAVRRIAMPFLRTSYEDMLKLCEDASLVITHTSAFAARLAAEKLGVPWLSIVLAPFAFMSSYDPPLLLASPTLEKLRKISDMAFDRAVLRVLKLASAPWTETYREMRRELGLPQRPNPLFEGQFSPLGTLALYSPLYGRVQDDFPPGANITGFCYYDGGGEEHGLGEDLEKFLRGGPAPLVFTIGSALVHEPRGFFESAAAAATQNGKRAVLVVGPYAKAKRLASRSVFVAEGYVPHVRLFPRAHAVIHHGGIGTTAQALRAGRPQLVVPFSADQPDNALRLVRLGVARTVPIANFTPKKAAQELDLLETPHYAPRALDICAALAQEDGPAAAAEAIERVLEMHSARLYA
ncbi:MAG TPA: glycosyltransferase [Caulobacterales bacterium]|nr:glycosyltransferase [Caulobacterales bacterium]